MLEVELRRLLELPIDNFTGLGCGTACFVVSVFVVGTLMGFGGSGGLACLGGGGAFEDEEEEELVLL